ncbi:MAG TPA: DEAD/DEAH box helicase [Polyangiaceae bacterium]|nr:DEAD/DEAH box helicase [Polyangiaceae bacterium]
MKELFETLKKQALPAIWAQGVKLAREDSVALERESDGKLELRVRVPARVAYLNVALFTRDAEWTCDCPGPADPCVHVVAAVLAAQRVEQAGQKLPDAKQSGAQLVYSFRRLPLSGLTLDRFILVGGTRTKLEGTLASVHGKFALSPGNGDLVVDRIITAAARGVLRPGVWPSLLEALNGAQVEFEAKPVRVSAEVVLPVGRVFDDGSEIVLAVEQNPELSAVVEHGLGRVGDTLRPLGLVELTGLKLERLPLKRRFSPSDVGELCTKVLPEIESKLKVAIESVRLPKRGKTRLPPRLAFELSHAEHTLSVVPMVVYGDPINARIESGKLVHVQGEVQERDEIAERRLIERLRDELYLVPGRRVDFDGQEANKFAQKLRDFQVRSGGDPGTMLVRSAPVEARVKVAGDTLSIEFEVPSEGDVASSNPRRGKASAEAVLRAWQDGLSLVPLEGGGWAPLPRDWLEKFGDRVADLLAARDAEGKVSRVSIPALSALCDDLDQPRPPSFDKLAPLIEGFQRLPEVSLPKDLTATLRSYQKVGVDWLCFLRDAGLGAVLADDMGLGKTLQTLCAVSGRALIVCPKSVVHNWEAEARRFRPGLTVSIYQGPRRELDESADLTITTYAILRLDAELLAAEQWDTVVLDEAQAIKNPDSQVSRAAYALKAHFPVALSGTPLENRLEELWSMFHFSHRGLLSGRSQFRDRYSLPIEQGNKKKLADLREKTKPFILRRLKREVAPELPPRTDMVLEVELEPAERELYTAVRAATHKDVIEKLKRGGNVLQALEALLRLRQAACHPSLLPGQHAETSSKIEALLESLEQVAAEGHKALVFSQWTSLLDLVEPHLERAGLRSVRLDGSTRDRAAVVREFQGDDGPPVMLTSLKAGGTGLNLTAADHVFLLDPWWNPAAEDQAADRAHRIGQESPVLVYRLIAKDTVEEGILALQAKKRALADAALEGRGDAAGITRDDLLALLA